MKWWEIHNTILAWLQWNRRKYFHRFSAGAQYLVETQDVRVFLTPRGTGLDFQVTAVAVLLL